MGKRFSKAILHDSNFTINQDKLDASPYVSADAKKAKNDKKAEESQKMASAKPSNFVMPEENDFHEATAEQTPSEGDVIKKIDASGTEQASSYSDVKNAEDAALAEQLSTEDDDTYTIEAGISSDVSGATNDQIGDDNIDYDNVIESQYGSYVPIESSNGSGKMTQKKVIVPVPEGKVQIYFQGRNMGQQDYVVTQGKKVVKTFYEPWMKMYNAAKSEGITLKLNDAFRTYEEQLDFRKNNVIDKSKINDINYLIHEPDCKKFNPWVSRPGYGMHHYGTAVDIATNGGKNEAYKWLVKNAYRFGFIRTVLTETWHWEYTPWKWKYRNDLSDNPFCIVKSGHDSWMGLSGNLIANKDFVKDVQYYSV